MTIVYDSRKVHPHAEFFEALQMVQVGACVLHLFLFVCFTNIPSVLASTIMQQF